MSCLGLLRTSPDLKSRCIQMIPGGMVDLPVIFSMNWAIFCFSILSSTASCIGAPWTCFWSGRWRFEGSQTVLRRDGVYMSPRYGTNHWTVPCKSWKVSVCFVEGSAPKLGEIIQIWKVTWIHLDQACWWKSNRSQFQQIQQPAMLDVQGCCPEEFCSIAIVKCMEFPYLV